MFCLGAHPAALEQGRNVVHPHDVAVAPGGSDGGVAAAGGDVEYAPTCLKVGGFGELFRRKDDA
jgi:hypothetical protein